MAFGYYLAVDLYDCDALLADDVRYCYDFLLDLVDFLKMEKQSQPIIYKIDIDDLKYPDKAGISGWIALVTSGIQLHTITPKNFVSIDIYTCGELCPESAIDFCANYFKAGRVETNFLSRGREYESC